MDVKKAQNKNTKMTRIKKTQASQLKGSTVWSVLIAEERNEKTSIKQNK